MPTAVDVAERLDDIARATLELARARRPDAITIRGVAAQLGRSTTVITKYVPSRAALLANTFRYVRARWDRDLADALGDSDGMDRLRTLARWSLSTDGYDDVIRRLWIEALSTSARATDPVDIPRQQAHAEHDRLRSAVAAARDEDADWLADVLFLAFRGYYLSTVEDPDRWRSDRAATAIYRLLDLAEAHTTKAPRASPEKRPPRRR